MDGVNPRDDAVGAALREACAATLTGLAAASVVLVGEGDATRVHDDDSWGTLAGFGVDKRIGLVGGRLIVPGPESEDNPVLPASLTAGLLLLHGTGVHADVVRAVEIGPEGGGEAALAGAIDACTDEDRTVVLIAVGEGSARSTRSSPGPFAAEAAAADARILVAIERADPAALAVEAAAADSLQISGADVWSAVCSILGDEEVHAASPAVHERPFGVEYFVGRWSVDAPTDNSHEGDK
ncbi:hypothetical protein GCM10027344_26020 [Spelaeicoccus albus]